MSHVHHCELNLEPSTSVTHNLVSGFYLKISLRSLTTMTSNLVYQFHLRISVMSNELHVRVNKTYNLGFVWFLSVPFAPCVSNRTTNGTCSQNCQTSLTGFAKLHTLWVMYYYSSKNKRRATHVVLVHVVCCVLIMYKIYSVGVEVICQIVVQIYQQNDDRRWPFHAVYFTHPLLVEFIIENNDRQHNNHDYCS